MNWNIDNSAHRSHPFQDQENRKPSESKSKKARDQQIGHLFEENNQQLGKESASSKIPDEDMQKRIKVLNHKSQPSSETIPADRQGSRAQHLNGPLATPVSKKERKPPSELALSAISISPKSEKAQKHSSPAWESPATSQPREDREVPFAGAPSEMPWSREDKLDRLENALSLHQFTSADKTEALMSSYRGRLADMVKRKDSKALGQEVEQAKNQREMVKDLINEMRSLHMERGDLEKNAHKFYYTKNSEASLALQSLSQSKSSNWWSKLFGKK